VETMTSASCITIHTAAAKNSATNVASYRRRRN
jgi:hypothetical protein